MPAVRVTEITDREEVRDAGGNLQYVEFLVAVLDRDPLDPPAAKVIGTEKVRVSTTIAPGRRQVRHINPVTEEEVDSYESNLANLESMLMSIKTDTQTRAEARENNRKWPQELLSS